MSTTQSEDLNERVNHPRHYNQHPSNIECIELVEHLPANLANATKYVWRCGLKTTETPLRDLKSARWYVKREEDRIELYELEDEPAPALCGGWRAYKPKTRVPASALLKTDVVWRSLARKVIEKDEGTLGEYLRALLAWDFDEMLYVIDGAIQELEEKQE